MNKKTRASVRIVRLIVQGLFLLLIALFSLNRYRVEQGLEPLLLGQPSLHAICPFGGLVTVYNFVTQGAFIPQIHASAWILMWLVLALAALFGPVFCGWVCPLGTVQEWLGGLGQKIFKKRYNRMIPAGIDRYLRYARYGVLILVLVQTARLGKIMFDKIDPYYALFNFWSGEVAVSAVLILGVTLVGALFVQRPWCKYVCPYGAFLGLFNLFRLVKLSRNPHTCINCKRCDNLCPMNITPSDDVNVINHQCITCLECTSEVECPVADALLLKIRPEVQA